MKKFEKWYMNNKNALKCKPRTQKQSYKEYFEDVFASQKSPQFKKGDIYFAKLTENAKTRPFLIFQNDMLNEACFRGLYHTVIVLPLSGQILGGDMRVLIKKRDNMTKDSEVVCSAIGIISLSKILFYKGLVTTLNNYELHNINNTIKNVLSINT